uniref:Uncharacterized protein n=1 Tax=Romanomermis culicivorax TaxID=13658 RepID=A0A915I8B5_ROMCU
MLFSSGTDKETVTLKSTSDEKRGSTGDEPIPKGRIDHNQVPVFIDSLKNRKVADGEKVVLTAKLLCHASTEVTWLKVRQRLYRIYQSKHQNLKLLRKCPK